jgi:uncharacterized protein (TIGR00369 family)
MPEPQPNAFQPRDPDFAARVRNSFAAQQVMTLIGALIENVEPGHCIITLPWREDLTQQNGFFHAGITATIADSAGGYAGYTLMPADSNVLTAEYKISLLRPAAGTLMRAVGRVIRAGRTLTFTEVSVEVGDDRETRTCATMTQTLACVTPN